MVRRLWGLRRSFSARSLRIRRISSPRSSFRLPGDTSLLRSILDSILGERRLITKLAESFANNFCWRNWTQRLGVSENSSFPGFLFSSPIVNTSLNISSTALKYSVESEDIVNLMLANNWAQSWLKQVRGRVWNAFERTTRSWTLFNPRRCSRLPDPKQWCT